MFTYNAETIRVIDGDTIVVDIDLGFHVHTVQTLRLLGINTPELRGPNKEAGKAAKQRLEECLLAGPLTVQTVKDRTGKYGRYLATIYADGIDLNELLVAEGHAVRYYQQPAKEDNTNGDKT